MTKETNKQDIEKTIEDGFKEWKRVLDELADSATKCYMPLLASSLKWNKEIVEGYRKSFKITQEKNK